MLSCWDKEPCKRPVFCDVVSIVDNMMAPLADYMDFETYYSEKMKDDDIYM